MWGLDDRGNFKHGQRCTQDGEKLFGWNSIKHFVVGFFNFVVGLFIEEAIDIESAVLQDIRKVRTAVQLEMGREEAVDANYMGRRLLYLFQKDLLPGVSGEIMESKNARDQKISKQRSPWLQGACWLVIAALNVGMLFYILLFSLQQTPDRQRKFSLICSDRCVYVFI
jgi:hypothetical protein